MRILLLIIMTAVSSFNVGVLATLPAARNETNDIEEGNEELHSSVQSTKRGYVVYCPSNHVDQAT
jgi:hypothetical protein